MLHVRHHLGYSFQNFVQRYTKKPVKDSQIIKNDLHFIICKSFLITHSEWSVPHTQGCSQCRQCCGQCRKMSLTCPLASLANIIPMTALRYHKAVLLWQRGKFLISIRKLQSSLCFLIIHIADALEVKQWGNIFFKGILRYWSTENIAGFIQEVVQPLARAYFLSILRCLFAYLSHICFKFVLQSSPRPRWSTVITTMHLQRYEKFSTIDGFFLFF